MWREEALSQRSHLGEIQIEPRHLPIVHSLEAGVQSTAHIHHHPIGMLFQERAYGAVKFADAQADVQLLEALPFQSGKVVGQLRDDFRRLGIVDQPIGTAAFGVPVGQRQQECLGDVVELLNIGFGRFRHSRRCPRQ